MILTKKELPDTRLYDLRHTCATLLLLAGVNPKVVSERMGYSSVAMTLDTYSHVLPQMQDAATNELEILLFDTKICLKDFAHISHTKVKRIRKDALNFWGNST